MIRSPLAVVAGAVVIAGLGGVAPSVARADEPEAVERTKRLIESEAKTILRAAHPLGKFTDADFSGYTDKSSVHEIVYTVNWKGKEKKEVMDFATKFAFLCTYDKDGDIGMIVVEVRADSCPSKAFRGANIVARVLRKQINKRLEDLGIEDEDLIKSLDKLDADGLLAVWLMYADRKKKK